MKGLNLKRELIRDAKYEISQLQDEKKDAPDWRKVEIDQRIAQLRNRIILIKENFD